ncbi:MAG: DUF1906 domain-containing protein, partial [Bacteroidetes bacterium]|nr:DUF1906 domain-containing protein [Bacteroidota bacterium]
MTTYSIIDTATPINAAGISDLQRAQIKTVIRYYAGQNSWKRLKPEEAAVLSSAGFQIMVVFEEGNSSSYFTHTQGIADAEQALWCASQINQPAGSAIYFAVDFDASGSDLNGPITDYF